jgi:DNA polymerase-2
VPTGFIVQPTYRVRSGRPVVQLFGRLASGEAFLVEDDRFRPYFFIGEHDAAALSGAPGCEIAESSLTDLAGRKVLRVTAELPGEIPVLREKVERAGGRALEADVRFPYRYLIDRGIRGGLSIEGSARVSETGLLRFRNPDLAPATCRPALTTLSIDLETTAAASAIYSIALVGAGVDEVHLVSDVAVEGAIAHADEARLLAAACARMRAIDPDIITGWNVVDFDLRVWQERCRALRVPCELGREAGPLLFHRDARFMRQSRADIPGRMVLDGIPLVRDAVRLEDYRLETAARSILGRGKLIDHDAPDPAAEITRLYREEPAALVAYNREDSRLVLDILEREGLLDLTIERSSLCGMQLDRVGASIASFDLVYLPELRSHGVVAASVDRDREPAHVRGGALLDPQPGLHANVAVYDFKSLYPSLIRTFNLDPLAHARAGPDAILAPGGARFARGDAVLPAVIERYMSRRDEAKARGDRHADQAIKIMMNAMFGVLGAASCRFFDPAIANAITGFGQQTLAWTRDAFEERGMRVLYGDTDSVFVKLEAAGGGAPDGLAADLLHRVGEAIASRVREQYGVEPRLVLELECVYERLFLPRVRGGTSGSKKRYAGWVDGELQIVGLESVRRDWPAVTRRLQTGMLTRLFNDEEIAPFVADLVARLNSGELDDELVYAKRIRKGSVDRYTASTPPHIQAARKAGERAGPIIRYVITDSGPEPALPGRPLPARIDHRHYIERVVRPVADAIFQELGLNFDEALDRPRQLSLL